MSDTFNGYHVWLGIPASEQPPNHYRLLGISIFETDLDVIEHAADRQMAHVRTFQSGRHGALSQQILNELAAARLSLLNAQRKAEYDKELRAKLGAAPTAVNPAPTVAPMPMGKAMPIGKAVPLGQQLPVAQPVAPVGAPTVARAQPAAPAIPAAPKPRISAPDKPGSIGPRSTGPNSIGVDEMALDLGQPRFPTAPVGMPIRVKRRKYNNNASWQSAAIVGTLLGIVVIGGFLLYSFLGPFLNWATIQQIWNGSELPPASESTTAPNYTNAPAAPLPAAPLPPAKQP